VSVFFLTRQQTCTHNAKIVIEQLIRHGSNVGRYWIIFIRSLYLFYEDSAANTHIQEVNVA
jgi:hypothetical protein